MPFLIPANNITPAWRSATLSIQILALFGTLPTEVWHIDLITRLVRIKTTGYVFFRKRTSFIAESRVVI